MSTIVRRTGARSAGTGALEIVYARAIGRSKNAEADAAWGESFASQVLAQGDLLLQDPNPNVPSDDRLHQAYLIGLPLRAYSTLKGALIFVRFGGPVYTEDHIKVARIAASLLAAGLLLSAPIPAWAVAWQPPWLALVLAYWCLAQPDRVGITAGFTLGLMQDALTGAPLGQHALALAVVAAAVLVAVWRCSAVASYLVAVIASQLVSPILWDHYAMLLLLPVAYLLSAGRWWAVAIPLVTAWPLVDITPPVAYLAAFWVTLGAVIATGWAKPVEAR